MDRATKAALVEYGRVIKKSGWKAGEPLIKKYEKLHPDFKKWAHAIGIFLRAEELVDEKPR